MRNREIKFRVWDTKQNKFLEEVPLVEEWIGADEWDDSEQISSNPFHWKNRPPFTNRLIWQQYTGSKDKNGKDIYEGDIVISSVDRPEVIQYASKWGSFVCYNGDLEIAYKNEYPNDIVIYGGNMEVIGNIFENPELAKDGI